MKKIVLKTIITVSIFVVSLFALTAISTNSNIRNIDTKEETATQKSKEVIQKASNETTKVATEVSTQGATSKNNKKKENSKQKSTEKNTENKRENSTSTQRVIAQETTTEITVYTSVEIQEPDVSEKPASIEENRNEAPTKLPPQTSDNNVSPVEQIDSTNALFMEALDGCNCPIGEIEKRNCEQLIIVKAYGNNAGLRFFEKNSNGIWNNVEALSTYGYVGGLGVSANSKEGSYETPAGLFAVGDMFYIDDKPTTKLNSFFKVTQNTYWVDDPSSQFYNEKVEGTENMDWNSAEHMIDYYSSYKYGFVIDFNTNPIIRGKGSAIFFHIGYAPTAGCVAVSEDMVLAYLERLNSAKNPYISIQ